MENYKSKFTEEVTQSEVNSAIVRALRSIANDLDKRANAIKDKPEVSETLRFVASTLHWYKGES